MKKSIATVTTAVAVLVVSASGASAGSPTCSELGWDNHGAHVLNDYVRKGEAGGGKPAHRGEEPTPGASFCLSHIQNPGLHLHLPH